MIAARTTAALGLFRPEPRPDLAAFLDLVLEVALKAERHAGHQHPGADHPTGADRTTVPQWGRARGCGPVPGLWQAFLLGGSSGRRCRMARRRRW